MGDNSEVDIEDGLFDGMEENDSLISVIAKNGGIESFLKSSDMVYARSVAVKPVEQHAFLQFTTDVDGCVVELKSLEGIEIPVRRLTLFPKSPARAIRSMLKKHIDLTEYTKCELKLFNQCVGFQLFYEMGWECWIGIIPSSERTRGDFNCGNVKVLCEGVFRSLSNRFQKGIVRNMIRISGSVLKNDINNVNSMTVLPDDQKCILSILQQCIDEISNIPSMKIILFCFRFGEKSRTGVSLGQFIKERIKRVTVHAAMNISSDVMSLMWSMTGLQQVVAARGVLRNALSFRECGNYQSNLDGRAMDITVELRNVIVNNCGKLRFIQLYTDSPHRRPQTRFHPVSGVIAGGMVFERQTKNAFLRDANAYISTMESNFIVMQETSARLEIVIEPYELKDVLKATHFINTDNVFTLLENRPMLVPFSHSVIKAIQGTGRWICLKLQQLKDTFSCKGNVEGIWKAYQLELALEKMLWGSPFCHRSDIYSVNLGPGKLLKNRSLTDQRVFLALELWSACMHYEECIPPCEIWTSSENIKGMIRRSVGIHDVLKGIDFVLGRRLLHTLIDDFYSNGDMLCRMEDFKRQLFSDNVSSTLVHGSVTINQIVRLLNGRRDRRNNMTFGVLCKMVIDTNTDVCKILLEGFKECRFKHFPAFKTYDNHGHSCLSWKRTFGLWKIINNNEWAGESPRVLSELVVAETERRGLIHVSKLKTVPVSFPWIEATRRKLGKERLDEDGLLCVLTFISCIALMMDGWFVDYNCLAKLMEDLPVNQYNLRDYEILSKMQMAKFNKFTLFRLHHSIPRKLPGTSHKEDVSAKQKEEREVPKILVQTFSEEVEHNRINDEGIADNIAEQVGRREPISAPLGKRKVAWGGGELEILHNTAKRRKAGVTDGQLYDIFKDECAKAGIPFRTLTAFRFKLKRM